MGLKMTLPKESNGMYTDFVDAYWCIEEIGYDTKTIGFLLSAYPSREAKQMYMHDVPMPSIGFGTSYSSVINNRLYVWNAAANIADIFPNGIPLDEDAQKTAIYNWVKAYTGLPFEDVFETEEETEEVYE